MFALIRRDSVLLLVLSLLALYQVWGSMTGPADPGPRGRYLEAVAGTTITDTVELAGRLMPLSQAAAGTCRLVVIYSPTCGASVTAATQWAKAKAAFSEQSLLPESWQAMWISAEPIAPDDPVTRLDLPALVGHGRTPGAIVSSLSIRAFPVYLTLDREGKVTGSSVGAPLPAAEDLSETCQIVSSPRA